MGRPHIEIPRSHASEPPTTIALAVGHSINIAQSRRHTYAPAISDGAEPSEPPAGSQTTRTPRTHLDQVQELVDGPIRNTHQL